MRRIHFIKSEKESRVWIRVRLSLITMGKLIGPKQTKMIYGLTTKSLVNTGIISLSPTPQAQSTLELPVSTELCTFAKKCTSPIVFQLAVQAFFWESLGEGIVSCLLLYSRVSSKFVTKQVTRWRGEVWGRGRISNCKNKIFEQIRDETQEHSEGADPLS